MARPLRVWAPWAKQLHVVIDGRTTAATSDGTGWWQAGALHHGARYAISVNGGPPRPDPRSPWQPDGVHGASCWIDLADANPRGLVRPVPLRDAILYELHIGTFTPGGTFEAAIDRLDDL